MQPRNRAALCLLLLLLSITLTGCGGRQSAGPEGVAAQLYGAQTAEITWDAVEGAERYRLYRREDASKDYQYLCDVEETRYLDSGLAYGLTYTYQVEAMVDGQLSAGTESDTLSIAGIPAITKIEAAGGGLAVSWSDTGGEGYRVYTADAAGTWTLAAETDAAGCTLGSAAGIAQLSVSAVYATAAGDCETERSQPETVLSTGAITAVTQMDRYTAVVQYEAAAGAEAYQIYRCETAEGTYTLRGTSYEPVYYDEIVDGTAYFYRVQPVTAVMEAPFSDAAALGYNAKDISGVAVFMYHEFVTQEDLDAGVAFDEYAIWVDEFEQDLRYLRDNGYTTITASELAAYLNGQGTLPEKAVMLTIDDGKLGVYKHAYPLLQEYGMKAVLALIGEEIDAATENPAARSSSPAPYCTWEEIGEMAASGTIEMASHTYLRHRYAHGAYTGADIAPGQSEEDFYLVAYKDYQRMDEKLKEVTGRGAAALAYPYSKNSAASDRVWLRCGYEILLCGDDNAVRHSYVNYYVQEAGVNYYSARTRRITRMTGTSLQTYLEQAMHNDDWLFAQS